MQSNAELYHPKKDNTHTHAHEGVGGREERKSGLATACLGLDVHGGRLVEQQDVECAQESV